MTHLFNCTVKNKKTGKEYSGSVWLNNNSEEFIEFKGAKQYYNLPIKNAMIKYYIKKNDLSK